MVYSSISGDRIMKKRSIITSSIVMIMLCFSIIAGATFALFTDTVQNDIVASSGKVDYSATVSGLKIWSIEECVSNVTYTETVTVNDPMLGKPENFYYKALATGNQGTTGTFTDKGTAAIGNDYKLTLERLVPGDKAEVTVNITNDSNVDTKFRIKVIAVGGDVEQKVDDLTDVLDVWVNYGEDKIVYSSTTFKTETDTVTKNKTDVEDARVNHLLDNIYASDCFCSSWYYLGLDNGVGVNASFTVTVLLPAQIQNLYQDLDSVTLTFRIEAIQANGANNH